MKKRLLITSTDLMMIQFLVPHVRHLAENGFDVEIACSEVGGRMEEVREALRDIVSAIHVVRLERSPSSPQNLLGYGDMKKIILPGKYDIVWTNEPVMGVVTRLAAREARKQGTKVVYMVHGFHFYKGSGILSWLAFYPVEYLMSYCTDMLVTINREDEERAKKMHAQSTSYVHGIGVNAQRLHNRDARSDIRKELGISEQDFLVVSVGELNPNKNHQVILRALAKMDSADVHYAICGKGELLAELSRLARELGIESRVHFLGYRMDVVDICSQSDVFVHASLREGISIASLEAMYCGLPLVISSVRGSSDYLKDGASGYICNARDAEGYAAALRSLKEDPQMRRRFGLHNREAVKPYTLENVKQEILMLFDGR